jgi:precorrin-3B synthase
MATGDGLLVRLHPLAGRLTADQARLIAETARQHGNSHLDVTARGNLQIRGVREDTYPALMTRLDQEGLVEPESDGPNRLVMISPLAGIDPGERLDTLALAQTIEAKARSISGLPAKFFIAIDGGSQLPLDMVGADLHLTAYDDTVIAFARAAPDGLHWIGETSLSQATEAVGAILSGYAAMRETGRTEARRLRDLQPDLILELAARAALKTTTRLSPRHPAPRAGILNNRNGKAVLLALPFGRCTDAQLELAASWSKRFGTSEIRLSFTRGILLPGVTQAHLTELLNEAAQSGFVTEAGDPRLSLHACPGKPDCASALMPAPADALRIAKTCSDLLSQGVTFHVSGCAKGCAHPGISDLTLIGRDDGRYGVVRHGCARDIPFLHLSVKEIMNRLLPLSSLDDLHRAFPENAR